jgi:hypothetical protein
MGYDLHITRAADWSDSESNPITFEEWVAYVDMDPEMEIVGFAETKTPDGVLRIEGPGLTTWTFGGKKFWLDHRRGRITGKY